MLFQGEGIDKNTPIPLYFQLKNIILNAIQEGALLPGDALPTEQDFSDIYGLSRTTIRQAITELAADGYLYRNRGKGTFVAKPKLMQDFMRKLEPFDQQIRRLGMTPKTEVLELCRSNNPSDAAAEALGLAPGDEVIYLRRLRYADNDPVVLLDTYLPISCEKILTLDMEKQGLYESLSDDPETSICRVVRQIEAVAAGRRSSHYLNIPPGYPVQLTTTIGYNKKGMPIEYSIAKYPGDKNKFVIELSV